MKIVLTLFLTLEHAFSVFGKRLNQANVYIGTRIGEVATSSANTSEDAEVMVLADPVCTDVVVWVTHY